MKDHRIVGILFRNFSKRKKKSGLAECILQYKVETGQKWSELGQIEGGGIIAVRATKLRPPCNLAQHVLLK